MQKLPSPFVSFIPLLVLIVLLALIVGTFGTGALSGPAQIALLLGSAVCVLIGMGFYKVPWEDFEEVIITNIKGVSPALIILLIIGALSASWMLSGIVPTLITYGVHLIHPTVFLVSACIICILVSVMTGSSWTTIATIGIALMGIGEAQGFSEGWIAGAIISGAYFGDKISPLSETTVLASSITKTPLFKHIRYMMITMVPSITITLVIFLIAGFSHTSADQSRMVDIGSILHEHFTITPWLLLVPLVTGILIMKKVPSIITLFLSTAMAVVMALIFQPDIISWLGEGGRQDLFRGVMTMLTTSTNMDTGNEMVNDLVATRGMGGMMETIWLILCSMSFGGAMTAGGMLKSITNMFVHHMKRTFTMVSSTVCSGLFLNIALADQYISIMLTGSIFRKTYEEKGYESCLLSRTIEDSVTVTSVLVPWNSCGLTQSTVLNVSTFTYMPYCFFNYLSPVMSVVIAAIGYKILKTAKRPAVQAEPESCVN